MKLQSLLLAIFSFAVVFSSCKKKDKPVVIPTITTSAMTNVTTTSATGGGNITANGNAEITAKGLVYSSTNAMPTLSDSKTEVTTSSNSFTSELTGLTSGSTYYVRAYATNSAGTGYGDAVTFMTGNSAPTATAVSVSGTPRVEQVVRAEYTYADGENDPESGTTFQWYVATDASGTGETAISGATDTTYEIKAEDEFKFIRVSVIPKASAGSADGLEVKSAYVGPVEEANTVTFMYNGEEVTYEVITTATGRKWMDRNLGAARAALDTVDVDAFGDLFQWGRPADGHQLINWSRVDGNIVAAPVNGTTSVLSSNDVPGHHDFITTTPLPQDWRSPQNPNLWQVGSLTNNPCPAGWRVPTIEEWSSEGLHGSGNVTGLRAAFNALKIVGSGYRNRNGLFRLQGFGYYWSSTIEEGDVGSTVYTFTTAPTNEVAGFARVSATPIRCIKAE